MENDRKIIDELNFVLTHPDCNALEIERFYNTCLFVYDSVPLFTIIEYMRKEKPKMLSEWSKLNPMVRALHAELEPDKESSASASKPITIPVDLARLTPATNGYYIVSWETELEEPIINALFKTKSLHVIDDIDGAVDLVGISQIEEHRYNLYVKKRR
jgi:hypothetical protein